jgi:chemotaxis protein MotB
MLDLSEPKHRRDEMSSPKWIVTFADMMSLLMCFFVLLLSFSEIDAQRYRKIAESMAIGFGGGTPLILEGGAPGSSTPAFAPDSAQPTPIDETFQPPAVKTSDSDAAAIIAQAKASIDALIQETQNDTSDLAAQLQAQIGKGEVELETRGRRIVLRIREKGSFGSGSADLQAEYRGLMHKVATLLADKPGDIQVQGHTDDIPIATDRFRSNWELSSARAVSVAEELLQLDVLDSRRVTVMGHADTRPLAANDSAENRARNRRVEIVIQQRIDARAREQLQMLRSKAPEYYRSLRMDDQPDLKPGEVF